MEQEDDVEAVLATVVQRLDNALCILTGTVVADGTPVEVQRHVGQNEDGLLAIPVVLDLLIEVGSQVSGGIVGAGAAELAVVFLVDDKGAIGTAYGIVVAVGAQFLHGGGVVVTLREDLITDNKAVGERIQLTDTFGGVVVAVVGGVVAGEQQTIKQLIAVGILEGHVLLRRA